MFVSAQVASNCSAGLRQTDIQISISDTVVRNVSNIFTFIQKINLIIRALRTCQLLSPAATDEAQAARRDAQVDGAATRPNAECNQASDSTNRGILLTDSRKHRNSIQTV